MNVKSINVTLRSGMIESRNDFTKKDRVLRFGLYFRYFGFTSDVIIFADFNSSNIIFVIICGGAL